MHAVYASSIDPAPHSEATVPGDIEEALQVDGRVCAVVQTVLGLVVGIGDEAVELLVLLAQTRRDEETRSVSVSVAACM